MKTRFALVALLAPAVLVGLLTALGPLRVDPIALWGGVGIGHHPGRLPGFPSIDPNVGTTSFTLGVRATLELLSGKLPLWNHYEGLGAPLLGEMQSAALFPPTWLLVLPYGQAIEHALLQAIAGLGTYLFLRRFGLGTTAALAGGLLFEFNGVFAWLRNAIYNPVALLPWLFFTIEGLFQVELTGPVGERWWLICLGAIAGALALYAGFPEVVYFYALLLALWAGLRAAMLPWRQACAFTADLFAIAVLALLISAPLLIAFGHFLTEALVGGHHDAQFRDHYLPPQAFLAALLPYVFGPISAAPQASVGAVWGDIGGYIGLTPLLLALAGLVCSWRHATAWLLALWVVLAVGASHGAPLLHGAFTALPLATIAAYARYLDAGWIFACVTLAAIFIDRVATLDAAERRRPVIVACVVIAALLGIGCFFAWNVLSEVLGAKPWQRWFVGLSWGTGAVLLCLFLLAIRLRRPAPALAWLAVAEAILWFMLPFASNPRFASVDRTLIGFLRDHAGLQRFAIGSGSALGPNFGSVFGIPAMNYDDLPVPARTARFVTTRLDATNDGVIFRHDAPPANQAERQETKARFTAALPGYAQAGVRYVLSADALNSTPAYEVSSTNAVPVSLRAGQEVVIDIAGIPSPQTIGTVSILVGTYAGTADGTFRLQLCQATRCASGAVPLADALDNRNLLVALDGPMALSPGTPIRISMIKEGGQHDVALWMRPAPDAAARLGMLSAPPSYLPIVEWVGAADLLAVIRTATTTVFEIPDTRPYASAPGCLLDIVSHDRIDAQCAAPSHLLRLEVFMRGWTARIDGADTSIVPIEDTFQGIDLPAGRSVVEFTYAPWGLRPSVPLAAATLALCLAVLGSRWWTRP